MVPANDNPRPLAAWCAGGDVILPGGPISLPQARQQLAWHARKALVAKAQGDAHGARLCGLIALDYHAAVLAAEQWLSAGRARA